MENPRTPRTLAKELVNKDQQLQATKRRNLGKAYCCLPKLCKFTSSKYLPFKAKSSLCVPFSTTLP